MSAPSQRIKQAEHIGYGLLAINAIEAINVLLDNSELTNSDIDALSKAEEFLRDIADGEELVTKATFHGRNSTASLKALDISIGEPLKELKKIAQDEKKFAEALRKLAEALNATINQGVIAQQADRVSLQLLVSFFELLNQSLMSVMTRSRQRLRSSNQLSNKYHNTVIGY